MTNKDQRPKKWGQLIFAIAVLIVGVWLFGFYSWGMFNVEKVNPAIYGHNSLPPCLIEVVFSIGILLYGIGKIRKWRKA